MCVADIVTRFAGDRCQHGAIAKIAAFDEKADEQALDQRARVAAVLDPFDQPVRIACVRHAFDPLELERDARVLPRRAYDLVALRRALGTAEFRLEVGPPVDALDAGYRD